MKIPKKVILAVAALCAVCIILVMVLGYLRGGKLFLDIKEIKFLAQKQRAGDLESVFSDFEDVYVFDPDLGAVAGTSEMNEAARKLFYRFWSFSDAPPPPLDEEYDRFVITKLINEKNVEVRDLYNEEVKIVALDCAPESTALFKSQNMQFVSANFNISKEMRVGDLLYTECASNLCGSIGPECILIRRPKNS